MKAALSADKIAKALDLSRATIWRAMRDEKLKYNQVGERRVITEAQLAEYVGEELAHTVFVKCSDD